MSWELTVMVVEDIALVISQDALTTRRKYISVGAVDRLAAAVDKVDARPINKRTMDALRASDANAVSTNQLAGFISRGKGNILLPVGAHLFVLKLAAPPPAIPQVIVRLMERKIRTLNGMSTRRIAADGALIFRFRRLSRAPDLIRLRGKMARFDVSTVGALNGEIVFVERNLPKTGPEAAELHVHRPVRVEEDVRVNRIALVQREDLRPFACAGLDHEPVVFPPASTR